MQIIQAANNNSTKWTIVFDRTTRYPAPGEIIAVSEAEINEIVSQANILLDKDDTFLQSSVTTLNESNFYSKKIFAPVAAENNSKEKFDVVLRVERLEQRGNSTYAITNSPFINMPKGIEMSFNADEAVVVDVKIANEHAISSDEASMISPEKLVWYKDKRNAKVNYEILVPAPEKIIDWLVSNLVKEFSLIFDFTKEIEDLVNALGRSAKINVVNRETFKNKNSQKSINVISLNDEIDTMINTQVDKSELDKADDIDEDYVSQHPLYQYTSDVTITVFEEIEEHCKLMIDQNVVTDIMQKVLHRMLSTELKITPPKRTNT